MGIKGLDKFIRDNTISTVSREKMNAIYGKTVIIDTSCLIYRYILHNEDKFMNIFKSILKKLEKYHIRPIFVFDGTVPDEKLKTVTKRTEKKKSALIELASLEKDLIIIRELDSNDEVSDNISKKYFSTSLTTNQISKEIIVRAIDEKITKVQKKSMQLKNKHIKQIKQFLDFKKISYIHTSVEADLVCAFFVRYELVDYCISDDTDMFPYNCDHVIRNVDFRNEILDIYNRQKLLEELEIDENQFLDLCILLGSDYIPRTIGIKPNNILYLIKTYYSIENIICNINIINEDKYISRKIYMNQMVKYESVRNLFSETFNFNDIMSDANIYCTSITNKLVAVC
jgi:flap endonuclease-1